MLDDRKVSQYQLNKRQRRCMQAKLLPLSTSNLKQLP